MTERFEVHIRARDEASPVLRKFQQNMRETETRSQRASQAMLAMADKAKWAFAGMATAIVAATKVYADFDRQMAEVSTMVRGEGVPAMEDYARSLVEAGHVTADLGDVLDTNAVIMDHFRSTVRDMAVEFGQSTETLSKGLYDILSAGIDASDALDVLEVSTMAAVGGITDVGTAADAITTIINAFGLEARDAEDIADSLFTTVFGGKTTFDELASSIGRIAPIAAMAGVEFDEVNAVLAVLTQQGLSTEEATTALRMSMLAFISPTEAAKVAAEEYGVQLDAATLQGEGLINAIAQMTGLTAEQTAALFPNIRALLGVAGATGDLTGMMEAQADQAERSGATMEAFGKMSESAGFSIDQLKQAVTVLVGEFGEALWPMVQEIIEQFRGWIDVLRAMDDEQKRALGELFFNLTKIIGLIAGLNMVAKAIMGIAAACGVAKAVMAPWIVAIAALVVAIATLDMYKDRIIPFFEELGRSLGILTEEMISFHATTKVLDPRIQELEYSMRGLREEIKRLEADYAPLVERMEKPLEDVLSKQDLERYRQLQIRLQELEREYNRLTATIPDTQQAIIDLREETAEYVEEVKRDIEALEAIPPIKVPEIDLPAIDEAKERIEALETALRQIEDVADRATASLRGMIRDTEWDIMISQAQGLEREMLQVQRGFERARASIVGLANDAIEELRRIAEEQPKHAEEAARRIEEIEREKNRALQVTNMQTVQRIADLWKAHVAERKLEADMLAEAEEAAARAKADAWEGLYREYLEITGQNLELILREHRMAYEKMLEAHAWTAEERAMIEELYHARVRDSMVQYVEEQLQALHQLDDAVRNEVIAGLEQFIEILERMGPVGREMAGVVSEAMKGIRDETDLATQELEKMGDSLIRLIGDIGDLAIDVHFGHTPGIGQIGGIFTGLLGAFTSIPGIVLNIFTMIFGWIDRIQRRTQEMIDEVTGNFKSAMVDFFMAPDLDTAAQDFGQRLKEITYRMMVDAIVEAIIMSAAVQDAAKQLGQAINQYFKDGCLDGLMSAFHEFEMFVTGQVVPLFAELYVQVQPYSPYYQPYEEPAPVHVGGGFPSYQMGTDYVPRDTWAYLHRGEKVISAGESIGDVNITVNNYGEPMDGRKLWEEFEYEARRRGVELARN